MIDEPARAAIERVLAALHDLRDDHGAAQELSDAVSQTVTAIVEGAPSAWATAWLDLKALSQRAWLLTHPDVDAQTVRRSGLASGGALLAAELEHALRTGTPPDLEPLIQHHDGFWRSPGPPELPPDG